MGRGSGIAKACDHRRAVYLESGDRIHRTLRQILAVCYRSGDRRSGRNVLHTRIDVADQRLPWQGDAVAGDRTTPDEHLWRDDIRRLVRGMDGCEVRLAVAFSAAWRRRNGAW